MQEMKRRRLGHKGKIGVLACATGVFALTCFASSLNAEDGPLSLQPVTGDPLDGLTSTQLDQFDAGKILFGTPILIEDGLGPIFNKSNCRSCHTNPDGGPGSIAVTHFGQEEKGDFTSLPGGSLFQLVAIASGCEEVLPPEANFTTTHITPGMMGYGLVEAIPDIQILAHADPSDSNGDGISGRVHWVQPAEDPFGPLRAGRFGWKAIVATVETFSGDATMNELGLTNALFPEDNAPNGDMAILAACDNVADPEDVADVEGFTFVDRVTHFQRYLASPPQTPKSGMTGEIIFDNIGCTKCHVQTVYTTSADPTLEDAIRNKSLKPYADFNLHDAGLLGDGLPQGDAGGNEFMTRPLWGMRDREQFFHDGRVAGGTFGDRVIAAIAEHGSYGEAADSAEAFDLLPQAGKNSMIAFFNSLGRREFDYDGDKDVDIDDFVVFHNCYVVDVVHMPDDACAIGDIDQDGDADDLDFAMFLKAYSEELADCDCDGTNDLQEIINGAPDADNDGVPDDCVPCVGDLNCDMTIDGGDLGLLLAAFGACQDCLADFNNDGSINGADLGIMLAGWGPCP